MVNGKIDILQEISDDHTLHVSFYNLDAGQYKKYFIEKNVTNLCTSFTTDILIKDTIKDFAAHTDPKIEPEKCPWPTGVIDVKNFLPLDSALPPVISKSSENWKAEFRLAKNNEFQGGFTAYFFVRNNDTLMSMGR